MPRFRQVAIAATYQTTIWCDRNATFCVPRLIGETEERRGFCDRRSEFKWHLADSLMVVDDTNVAALKTRGDIT